MPLPTPESFVLQPDYDLVIVGSGGASMCAALLAKAAGLDPVILEKRNEVGGSTGFSGGVWWVPNNPVTNRAGVADSPELAYRYFASVVDFIGKGSNAVRRDAFIDEAPKMIAFLERQGMIFDYADGWSDYYDDRPGGQPRGRSLLAEPFDLNGLGPWKDKVSTYGPFRNLPLGSFYLMQMMLFKRSWKGRRVLAKLIATIVGNKLRGRDVVASGAAIQARMLEMTLKRGIPIFTGFAADRLIEEERMVVAVEGNFGGKRVAVRARRGVLLNTGGFARNEEMRQKYQRKPISAQWTNANPGDTGEMLEDAMRLGADTENLDMAVWVPTSLNPDLSMPEGATAKDGSVFPFMHNADIGAPHIIMVDKNGRRYVNEAQSYMELGEVMYSHDAIPTFAVFDRHHMKRYVWGPKLPGAKPVKKWLESGYLVQADTIEELADKAGIDPPGLTAEIAKFNGFARTGVDTDFHKGDRAYDRMRGDPTVKPNPCLGAIATAPFYAIRLYPADVGTFGGLVTDEHARVLRADGSVIEGLYAAGNCTSSVMGRSYLGAGASISASFAFGYIAAKDVIARKNGAQTAAV